MPFVRQHHELAGAGDDPDHLAGLHGQQLVTVAVEQQERPAVHLLGLFTPGRLRRKGHDACHRVTQGTRRPYRDRAAERVAHGDRSAPAAAGCEVDRGAHSIVHRSRSFGLR